MAERREQINIDDFGNLISGRAGPSHFMHVTHRTPASVASTAAHLEDDLQEQISWYRKEVDRKEKLIGDIRKSDLHLAAEHHEYHATLNDSLVNEYKLSSEKTREELALTVAKMQSLESELKSAQHKLTLRSADFAETREENCKLKENNARQSVLINSMRATIVSLEEKMGEIEHGYRSRHLEISDLKAQNSLWEAEVAKYKEIILELEVIKSSLVNEKGDSVTKRREMYLSILSALGESSSSWDTRIPDDINALTSKIDQMKSERDSFKEELTSVKSELAQMEALYGQSGTEVKAGRETIMRLVSETEELHNSVTDVKLQLGSMESEKANLESEIERLNSEIGNLQAAIGEHGEEKSGLESEIESLKSQISSLTSDNSSEQQNLNALKYSYDKLRENVAALLSCSYQFVDKSDDSIVLKLREFLTDYKSRKHAAECLQKHQNEMNCKLNEEHEKYQKLLEKLMQSERGQSSITDIQKERVKFLEFIEKLSHLLKMDKITCEVGLEVNSDAILHRVKQLSEKEDGALAEKTSTVYQLQRKVKHFKEEVDSKELHLDMLRKKVAGLEEKSAGKVALFQEKEENENKIRKIERMNEKLRGQLGDCKVHITSLKSEMADINSFKLKLVEKDEEIRILVDKLDHLEKVRNKQAKQLGGLKQELKYVDYEAKNTTNLKEENIGQLSDQLTHAKRALDEIAKRERQLAEFRGLVAKMLGMNVCALTVPDYEIISKLEKLLHHHHVETSNTVGSDMDNFWEGYERAKDRLSSSKKKAAVQTAW